MNKKKIIQKLFLIYNLLLNSNATNNNISITAGILAANIIEKLKGIKIEETNETEKNKVNKEKEITTLKNKLSFIEKKNLEEYNLLTENISKISKKEINFLIKIIDTLNKDEDNKK